MEMKDTTVSKLKRNPQCGQYSTTFLFDILHLVALFALGGGWVFYLSRTHQDIGLAKSAFGHVLQVDIDGWRPEQAGAGMHNSGGILMSACMGA